jgi:hypothetical protein
MNVGVIFKTPKYLPVHQNTRGLRYTRLHPADLLHRTDKLDNQRDLGLPLKHSKVGEEKH